MTRYKLWQPETGDQIHSDSGETQFVAGTIEEARALFDEYLGEPTPYLHSWIGRCRIVYARDVENGDCHDEAEPGDTTLDYLCDDGRELASNEVRVWARGWPGVRWSIETVRAKVTDPTTIPKGVQAHHPRLGHGRLHGTPRRVCGGRRWGYPIEFGWPSPSGVVTLCTTRLLSFWPNSNWPALSYRVTVAGDVVGVVNTEAAAHDLLDLRLTRLRLEWEAAQDATRFAPPVSGRGEETRP